MQGSDPGADGGSRQPWDALALMLAWLNLVQEIGAATLDSTQEAARISQARWDVMRRGAALMAELPLRSLEDSGREVARLRVAVEAVRTQLDLFEEQLDALEQVLKPVREWAGAWRTLMDPPD